MYLDITYPLSALTSVYEGDPIFTIQPIQQEPYYVSSITLGSHTGTHIDAPLHYIKGGKSISQLPLETFCGPAKVLHIQHTNYITIDHIAKEPIAENDIILFRTDNDRFDGIHLLTSYTGLSLEAAKYLIERKVRLIGIDYLTIEPMDSLFAVHEALLSAQIPILEMLDLKNILPGSYELFCFPLKIIGADASPVRAVLKTLIP